MDHLDPGAVPAALSSACTDPEQSAAGDSAVGEAVRLPEVFVGGEGLARGPADVLGTLLHEAAHALAHVRGIKDTSRQGRWHNARFKALAEELGTEVTKGLAHRLVPDRHPCRHPRHLRRRDRRAGAGAAAAPVGGDRRWWADEKAEPAAVRVRVRTPHQGSPTVLAACPISCRVCGTNFTPDLPDEDPNGEHGGGEQG